LILDAGFLISVDRGEDSARFIITAANRSGTALHTTHPVVAQVWRDGSRQARLASFLRTVSVHPFDDGPTVGRILGLSGSADVVDAHLVIIALRLNDDILTGDPDDLGNVANPLGSAGPSIHRWP
jgi:hypothetical protein